jgi:hypothetical protein
MKKLIGITVLVMLLFATSCTKDDSAKPDLRDQIVGTYDGSVLADIKYSSFLNWGLALDSEKMGWWIIITKDSTSSDSIIISGAYLANLSFVFKATSLKSFTDGILFNIPSQTSKTQYRYYYGGGYSISGLNCVTVEGIQYNGCYNKTTNTLTLGVQGTMPYWDDNGKGKLYNIPFTVNLTSKKLTFKKPK